MQQYQQLYKEKHHLIGAHFIRCQFSIYTFITQFKNIIVQFYNSRSLINVESRKCENSKLKLICNLLQIIVTRPITSTTLCPNSRETAGGRRVRGRGNGAAVRTTESVPAPAVLWPSRRVKMRRRRKMKKLQRTRAPPQRPQQREKTVFR